MIYVCSLSDENEALLEGKALITTIEELYQVVIRKDTEVLLFRDNFIDEYFIPSGFSEFVKECRKLNQFMEIRYNRIYDVDHEYKVDAISRLDGYEELVDYIMHYKEDATRIVKMLCRSYTDTYKEALTANNKLSTMHLELAGARSLLESEKASHSITRSYLELTTAKLDTLVSRINYNYDKNIDENKLFGINVNTSSYRKILYVKELTRVHYTDTLLYYLLEVLKTLYNSPARFVVIESPYAYKRVELYPTCKSHTDLTYTDIQSSNIFMAGFQQSIMEAVLKNPSDADYLIVLDRSGWELPMLKGEIVETIFTVSDLKDIKYSVPLSRVISYSKETLHVPYLKDYEKLPMEVKIGKYSSMDIMKALIELLERSE